MKTLSLIAFILISLTAKSAFAKEGYCAQWSKDVRPPQSSELQNREKSIAEMKARIMHKMNQARDQYLILNDLGEAPIESEESCLLAVAMPTLGLGQEPFFRTTNTFEVQLGGDKKCQVKIRTAHYNGYEESYASGNCPKDLKLEHPVLYSISPLEILKRDLR